MNPQDELADLIRTTFYRDGGDCDEVADAILADFDRLAGLLGYVKADGEEWGVRVEGYTQYELFGSLEEAREIAESDKEWCSTRPREIVRRTVGHGPWEVA